MGFLREILGRPKNEAAFLRVATGVPADDATVPRIDKKPLIEIARFVTGDDPER